MKNVFLWILAGAFLGCAPVTSSPFSEQTNSHPRLHSSEFEKLNHNLEVSLTSKSEIVFAAMTDSHQNYKALENWISNTNSMELDFLVSLGDLTNQGANYEYDAFLSLTSHKKYPLFVVIGNHDAVGKGKLIFKRLFGAYNYSFEYQNYKFIFFNNNRIDFRQEGIDWDWLRHEVQTSLLPAVVFMHAPPDDNEYFDEQMRDNFWNIIRGSKVRLMMNGHLHVFNTEIKEGVLRHQVERLGSKSWARVTLSADSVGIENCQRRECHDEVLMDYSTDSSRH